MGEWRELFNGVNLDGWEDFKNPQNWSVEDGMIVNVCKGKGMPTPMSNLSTAEQFGDFELTLEYMADAKVNSGVFIRVSDLKDEVHSGLEFQIIDSTGEQPPMSRNACGALYDLVAPRVNAMRPPGQWNTYRIRCQGPRIEADLNGQRVVEANLDDFPTAGLNPDGTPNKFKTARKTMPRRGHIGLQTHPGIGGLAGLKVRFRNIRIRPL